MKQRIVLWFFLVLYSLFALYELFFYGEQLYEYIFYGIFLIILIVKIKKLRIRTLTAVLIGLVPFLHTVGMIPFFVNGEQITIYGTRFWFGYSFDFITHIFGFLIVTLIALQVIKNYRKTALVIMFFALIGLGTCFELNEFYGYYVFGFGEGAFHFGEGDNSKEFGPWGDSMTDTVANILGIILGYVLHFGSLYIKKKTNKSAPNRLTIFL
ncbi:hypothetical protein KY345_01260 [Candidatus Woesearchaeota archaeon]|nr:hypothetical protein [Candidatus Woesearchaeota archaeon]